MQKTEPGIRAGLAIAILATAPWTSPLAGEAQDPGSEAGFDDGASGAALEGRLADMVGASTWSTRWRYQSRAAGYRAARIYQRIEWSAPGGGSLFALVEKDPGERDLSDFASFHAQTRMAAVNFVVGELRPGFAQGLVFSRRTPRGGSQLVQARTDNSRIGYRSTGENHSIRGIAASVQVASTDLTAIVGELRFDARTDNQGIVTSLPQDGYHVSDSQSATADRLRGRLAGVRLHQGRDRWLIGGTVQAIGFSRPLDLRRPGRVEYAYRGSSHQVGAVDLLWKGSRMLWFGEAALQGNAAQAWVAGVRWRRSSLAAGALARSYDAEFHSFFGGAHSAGNMKNERGLLIAGSWRSRRFALHAFADRYIRARRTYFYPLPGATLTWGSHATWRLHRMWEARLVAQRSQKPRWRNERAVTETSTRSRVDLTRSGQGWLRSLKLRGEGRLLRLSTAAERGINLSASTRIALAGWRLTIHGSRFRTASWSSRIYEFEYDLPGAVSIRPLSGNGWRIYALAGRRLAGFQAALRYRFQCRTPGDRKRLPCDKTHLLGFQVDMESG